MKLIKSIIHLLFPAISVAICYCPVETTDKRFEKLYDRRLCEDNEAGKECDNANLEVTDMVNSIGRNADLFLEGKIIEGLITSETASFLRSKLSFALEKEKPVADCQDGLATNIRAKGTSTWCFSEKLLNECQRINLSINGYSDTISTILQAELLADKNSPIFKVVNGTTLTSESSAFVKAIAIRGAVQTGKIRCAAYESTIDDITNSASSTMTSYFCATLMIIMTLCL